MSTPSAPSLPPLHKQPRRLIDILRKALIVVLLIGAMLLLHQFALPSDGFDPRGLLALGFLILAAYTIGELVEVVRIPHITGYLLAGIVFGPSTAKLLNNALPAISSLPPLDEGIVSARVLQQLSLVDALALALIALTAGGELKLEELRRSIGHVMTTTLGMVAAVVTLVTLYVVVLVAVAPGAMPMFAPLEPWPMLSLALVLATLAAATSPAVAIAVINSTGARGPVATTVLTGVVVGEITVVLLFSATSSIALGLLGGTGSISVMQALMNVAASIGVGIVVGIGIALYLRYVATELLLFLLAIIYATTFVLIQLHGEAAVAFIAAGLVVGNLSDRGETLIREMERLSRPTYVVFFALAGAKLDLDILWSLLLPAAGLFLVRGVGVYFGSRAGARLGNAPPTVQEYAWMGFVSQAGLAIALATQARAVLPDGIAQPMFSITIAVISIAEMVGPLVLQTGLERAGELGGPATPPNGHISSTQAAQVALGDRREVQPWDVPTPVQPWGVAAPTGSETLDDAIAKLELDLQALLADHIEGPLQRRQEEMEQGLRQLRREWLSVLRKATSRLAEEPTQETEGEQAVALREDVARVTARWRELLLELHARLTLADVAAPLSLLEALDQKAMGQRRWIRAGVVDAVLAPRPERLWTRLRRMAARVRQRWLPRQRTVDLLELARYHLSGELPGKLSPLLVTLVRGDLHLGSWITALSFRIADDLEAAARLSEQGASCDDLNDYLVASRARLDPLFQQAATDLRAIGRSCAAEAAAATGQAMQSIRTDATLVSTLELPASRRRYGRVFAERNRGLQGVVEGLRHGRQMVSARQAQVELELELVGLGSRVRAAVRERARALERDLRGRGSVQLDRVSARLAEWLERVAQLLEPGVSAGALSRQLRREADPLLQKIVEARSTVEGLVAELSSERWVSDLTQSLVGHTLELSESASVPTEPIVIGPLAPPPMTQLAFRELVTAFVETRVARDLLDVMDDLSMRVREMAAVLQEAERVTSFNVELSCAELDVLDEAQPLSPETIELVRAMVVGAVGRSHHRLARLIEQALHLAAQTEGRVHDSVLAQFESLRTLILGGAVGELRAVWLRDVRMGQLARRAEAWGGFVPELWERSAAFGRRALGEERIEAIRARLGLPPREDQRDQRTAFAPPEPSVEVPVVYRRLFSELPLDTADRMVERQPVLQRLRTALTLPGPLRVAAVVGTDLQGAMSLASAVVRGDFAGVLRLEARAPMDEAGVERWLMRAAELQRHAVLIEGLHWLFARRPGGLLPMQRLIDGMLADRGNNSWLLVSNRAVWGYLCQATAVLEVATTVVELPALDVDELEREVLARHAMSGYAVEFDADDDLGWQLQHVMLRGEDRERRRRRAWFRTLHAASNGVLQDALRLWMAAIREVDDQQERVRIGAVPRPPLTRLAHLPDDILLTLLETGRQGWTDPEQHARLFRLSRQAAEAHLLGLAHLGLLVRDGEVLRIAPHLRSPVQRVLAQRGWA
jgi:Kef-type K+ transport system membrane component KefB